MKRCVLFFALPCILSLLSGCSSVPKEGASEVALPASTNAVTSVTNKFAAVEAKTSSVTNAPAAAAKSPQPKPWDIKYGKDSFRAKIDSVNVFLGRPTQYAKANKLICSSVDQRFTVAPLTKGRDYPLVTNRPIRICLDPGHGGDDPGSLSFDKKTKEKEITLDIAKRLQKQLQKDGFEVMLTRRDNSTTQSLPARVAKARRWRADAFVSIHLNANSSKAATGVETYLLPARTMESTGYTGRNASKESSLIYPGNSNDVANMQLAFCVQRRMQRKVKLEDRGVRRARFVVLRESTMPAILVECGFITSNKDLAILTTSAGRERFALGIYEGIADWAYGTMAPGLPAHTPGKKSFTSAAGATSYRAEVVPKSSFPVEYVTASTPQGEASEPVSLPQSPALSAARAAAKKAAGITD